MNIYKHKTSRLSYENYIWQLSHKPFCDVLVREQSLCDVDRFLSLCDVLVREQSLGDVDRFLSLYDVLVKEQSLGGVDKCYLYVMF